MTTKNSISSNIPIEVAKGGTNTSSFANTNGVIYYDGTRLISSSVGTSTHVYTSNGALSAPTFQNLVGSYNLISTQTAAASASINFDGLTTYNNYQLTMSNVVLSSSAVNLLLAVSDDNGATWKNSGYLSGLNYNAYNSATRTNANSTTSFLIGNSLDNTDVYSSTLNIFNVNVANPFIMTGNAAYTDSVLADFVTVFLGGNAAIEVDAIQIIPESGTITSGTFSLYGYGV